MTNRSEVVAVHLPVKVWGRMASEAEHRGVSVSDLMTAAVRQVIAPPIGRAETVLWLARMGRSDREICERTGETRSYVATVRQRARIKANKDSGAVSADTIRRSI